MIPTKTSKNKARMGNVPLPQGRADRVTHYMFSGPPQGFRLHSRTRPGEIACSLLLAVILLTMASTGRGADNLGEAISSKPKMASTRPGADNLEETTSCQPFGTLAIFRPAETPKGLLILISDAPGWNAEAAEFARSATGLNYLVAGIDLKDYLARTEDPAVSCWNPLGDFERLGRFLEARYGLGIPKRPVLMGFGAGGALVYALIEKAPNSAYHAAISLDFCPSLLLKKPVCGTEESTARKTVDGQVTELLAPREHVETVWFVFLADPACDLKLAAGFVNHIDNARLVTPAKESPTVSRKETWSPQLLQLLQWLDPSIPGQLQPDTNVEGIPLREVEASPGTTREPLLALMLSGDGGWAELDRAVADELAKRGISTVGWDTLSYFWKPKTPEQAGRDLERVLQYYLRVWKKDAVLLLGYSLGADVLAFLANRLSPDMQSRVRLVVFLGLGKRTSFEFHLMDWVEGGAKDSVPVIPEVEKLTWAKRVCIFGDRESESGCPDLRAAGVTVIEVPGDHHFERDYQGIVNRLLANVAR